MLILAHRGYHQEFPENTLLAFEAAIKMGCDGIETDVRLSADELPILFHNRIFKGMPVASLTRRALEQATGYPVPTLEEALALDADILWNIEIKTLAALPATIKILKPYLNRRRLLVTSFCHDVVVQCASQLDVDCGLLAAHRPLALNTLAYSALAHHRLRTLVWDFEIIDELQLRQANQVGLRNFVYGAATQAEQAYCRALDVHGLITDYPIYPQ